MEKNRNVRLIGNTDDVLVTNFARIVPPYGTWGGLWITPAPFHQSMRISYEENHSYWTGIVEFEGDLWLFRPPPMYQRHSYSLKHLLLRRLICMCSCMMLVQVVMYRNCPKLVGHITRFTLPCGLLRNFWIMMHPNIIFVKIMFGLMLTLGKARVPNPKITYSQKFAILKAVLLKLKHKMRWDNI
jgi:hypothetical protein